jgi:hypothetical protein
VCKEWLSRIHSLLVAEGHLSRPKRLTTLPSPFLPHKYMKPHTEYSLISSPLSPISCRYRYSKIPYTLLFNTITVTLSHHNRYSLILRQIPQRSSSSAPPAPPASAPPSLQPSASAPHTTASSSSTLQPKQLTPTVHTHAIIT